MKQFNPIKSRVIPLPLKNVDTDLIIPAQFLTNTSVKGYGAHIFRRLKDQDPNFPFGRLEYENASVLVADDNFGCGSSREHAVWALIDAGIEVVICKSFADIFLSNSQKNGLLPVILPPAAVESILACALKDRYEVTVDLCSQQITCQDQTTWHFDFDPFRKHCLLNGVDDIQYIQLHADQLTRYRQQTAQPWSFSTNLFGPS